MTKNVNRKAALVAILPAIMIPVQQSLQAHHAPDFVIGSFGGVTIGIMILLLVSAIRDQKCHLTG